MFLSYTIDCFCYSFEYDPKVIDEEIKNLEHFNTFAEEAGITEVRKNIYIYIFNYFILQRETNETSTHNMSIYIFFQDSELREETCALLKVVATHSTEAHKVGGAFGSEDAHYFLDLDMAVLGSLPENYAEYRGKIRGEYAFLSEPMYTALRLKVQYFVKLLQHFISI